MFPPTPLSVSSARMDLALPMAQLAAAESSASLVVSWSWPSVASMIR